MYRSLIDDRLRLQFLLFQRESKRHVIVSCPVVGRATLADIRICTKLSQHWPQGATREYK